MGTTLTTYPSSSNPAKKYNVILGNDGVVYCDCMGWKMNKRCRHLAAYHKTAGKIMTPVKVTEPANESIATTIERVVASITRGE